MKTKEALRDTAGENYRERPIYYHYRQALMMKSQIGILVLIWMAAAVAVTLCCNINKVTFSSINSTACINSQFVRTLSLPSALQCSIQCAQNPSCQAFTHHQSDAASAAVCRHFVFDKCSKNVTRCGCTDPMVQVFVRQQMGLAPGLLCPSSYTKAGAEFASSLCDVRYKLYDNPGNWTVGKQKCDSEPGLTIMADVTSSMEKDSVISMRPSDSYYVFLSGVQIPGSSEPGRENFYWSSCNISLDPTLWADGEPNNYGSGGQNVTGIFKYSGPLGLFDLSSTENSVKGVLCECLFPF